MKQSARLLRLCATLALMAGASLAHAQYSWIGPYGVRQFSDRPPPPGTPASKILKAPAHAPDRPPPPAAAVAAPAVAPPTLAQQEAAYQQRQKQRADQERKDADEAQRRTAQAERCDSARQVRAQAASGMRQVRIDAQGERVVVSEEEKAAKLARAEQVLAGCT